MNEFKFALQNEDFGVVPVENVFIRHFMPDAQGAYVKVYLYGLHCCQTGKSGSIDNQALSEILGMTENDVIRAWEYWEKQNIIDLEYKGTDVIITYYNISAMLSGYHKRSEKVPETQPREKSDSEIAEMYQKIQDMYKSRIISQKEVRMFKDWMEEYHFTPQTVVFLVSYSLSQIAAKNREFTSGQIIKYMAAVAEAWYKEGIRDYDSAEKYVDTGKRHQKLVYDVFRLLGLKRNPIQWEGKMIVSWEEELNYSMAIIEEAIRRTNKPDIRYINGILRKWHQSGYTTLEQVQNEKRSPAGSPAARTRNEVPVSDARRETYKQSDQLDEEWLWQEETHE